MTTHKDARLYTTRGYEKNFGVQAEPLRAVLQACQGVGWLETDYGAGWHGDGAGSNNIGAIQAGNPPCNPATSFLYTDTNPTNTGTNVPYQVCFRRYATPELGWADLVRVMYVKRPSVLEAAKTGDLYAVSEALYDTNYYRGFGATKAQRVAHHYAALRSAVNRAAVALSEKMPDGFDPLARVLKWSWLVPIPSRGEDVKRVQRIVGIDDDGWYGSKTAAKVKAFQIAYHGLQPDGVVGMDTWHAIQEAELAIAKQKLAA